MSFRENGAFLAYGGGFRGSPLGEGVCGRPARGCSQGEASPFPKNKKKNQPFDWFFFEYPQAVSNRCCGNENPESWATRR